MLPLLDATLCQAGVEGKPHWPATLLCMPHQDLKNSILSGCCVWGPRTALHPRDNSDLVSGPQAHLRMDWVTAWTWPHRTGCSLSVRVLSYLFCPSFAPFMLSPHLAATGAPLACEQQGSSLARHVHLTRCFWKPHRIHLRPNKHNTTSPRRTLGPTGIA